MPITFQATQVEITKQPWGLVVALSAEYDESSEDERYLMLQAKHKYTKRDVSLGMNDIYIECCGQGWSWYGHILTFILTPKSICVQLDAEAAEHMLNDGRIEIGFSIDSTKYAELQNALRHIFRGRSYYAEHQA